MPFNMGWGEILVIFLLIMVLFGAKRLPELARSMGRSIKEFKRATQDLRDEFDLDKIEEPSQPRSQQRSGEKATPRSDSQD